MERKRKGVFICDGGCHLFRAMSGPDSRTFDEVAARFLRDSSTIHFVCAIDVVGGSGVYSGRPLRFDARCWSTDKAWSLEMERQLNEALMGIGRPEDRPSNSLNHMNWAGRQKHLWSLYDRGAAMSHNSLQFSLRAVMDYLAGNVDRTGFEKIVHPDWLVDLKTRLDRGQSVEDVRVEPSSSGDDDILAIIFGGHDAARAPFRKRLD